MGLETGRAINCSASCPSQIERAAAMEMIEALLGVMIEVILAVMTEAVFDDGARHFARDLTAVARGKGVKPWRIEKSVC